MAVAATDAVFDKAVLSLTLSVVCGGDRENERHAARPASPDVSDASDTTLPGNAAVSRAS